MYLEYTGGFSRLRTLYFKRIVRRLALRSGSLVLDYGCGPGDFLLVAQRSGLDVVGVDNSDRSIALAAKRGLVVSNLSTCELAGRPARYDAIIAQSVLEHVSDALKLVSELAALLAPRGILVLSAPTPGPYFWDDPTHVRPYTPKAFSLISELAGLKCEYLGYVFAFLLGRELRSALIFPLMNVIPASLGSNLIAFMRKPEPERSSLA